MYRLQLLLIFSLLFSVLHAKDIKNILILHSYHQSYKWTDDINSGINSIFKRKSQDYKFYIEYMDTKRFIEQKHYDYLYELYKQKYSNTTFDVIILSDNNAFNFVKEHHKSIFKRSPVVFLGVNYVKPKDIIGFENVTGINEQADLKTNYKLIQKLHPKIKYIYTIVDDTTTGRIIKNEMKKVIPTLKTKVEFRTITNVTLDELKTQIKTLPEQSALLLTVFFRSKDNLFFEYFTISNMISQMSDQPLYGLWDFNLDHGIIGGFLTSGFFQGREAARMAEKILEGIPTSSIPVLYKSPNNYMFDYSLLQENGITLSSLPKNSYIINEPVNIYEKYKKEILSLIVLIAFLVTIIILLLIIVRQKDKTKRQIKKELRFQQTLIDTVDAPIYYKNINGIYIGCNKAFEQFLKLSKNEIVGRNVFDILPNNLASLYTQKDKEILLSPHPQQYEGIHEFENEEKKNLIFYKNVYYDENNNVSGIVGTIFDITHLKQITQKLNELNLHLEEKVHERTHELKITNKELEATIKHLEQMQKRVVENEVMNSLGNIVAGVAHEINTPVGIGITASSHFIEEIKRINELFEKDEISLEEFESFLKKSQELIDLISNNFHKTATLIRTFKQVSVNNFHEDKRHVWLKEYMQTIISSIKSITKQTNNVQIYIDCDEEIEVQMYTGAFSQIITNLILNSIHHGFDIDKLGNIYIHFEMNENQLNIIYKDDGKGIKKEDISKIFDPFFTTRRIKGQTGLGLNVIYNIIVAKFNGTITCKSEEQKGVEFTIKLSL